MDTTTANCERVYIDLIKKNKEVAVINTVPLFCNDQNCSMEKMRNCYIETTNILISKDRAISENLLLMK